MALASVVRGEENRGDHPESQPLTPQEQLKRFKVPPGFEVQLVAAEQEIQKPINLTFDAAGRLWVTGSESYPWPAATDALGNPLPDFEKAYEEIASAFGSKGNAPAIIREGRDTVRILSDFGQDGHARKVEVFADQLNIPTGIQPLPRKPGAKGDAAIVFSIPNIWRFEDTDGDGVADKREPLYEGFGYLDTHGMSSNYIYWVDGWIYGCHGFRNHSEVRDRSGNITVFDSGNTYRFKPDGSKIEYFTHGQTNPFGLAFDPDGNLYSADSHSKPIYLLLRGGYYEGIGKQHDGLGFAPRITDDDHGSSGIAGVMYYADNKWPAEFHGNLFNGNPVTQRINRATLEWHGSMPKATRVADFLTCDDPWFRPVQTKLGPDGSLYIADFYNSIIGHYEVPLNDPRRDHTHGRIWRVVWRGEKGDAPVAQAPDLSALDAKGLVEKLEDSNLEVRRLATNELVDRVGKEGLVAWREVITPAPRVMYEAPVIPGLESIPGASLPTTKPDFSDSLFAAAPLQRKSLLWVLHRFGELTDDIFRNAVGVSASRGSPSLQTDRPTRIDALRIATEHARSDVYGEHTVYRWAVQGVLRELSRKQAASSGTGSRPEVSPLMARFAVAAMPLFHERRARFDRFSTNEFGDVVSIAADDTKDPALRYTAKRAIRDVLMHPGELQDITDRIIQAPQTEPYTRSFADLIADVCLAVPTRDAALFLIEYINRYGLNMPRMGEYLRHAATHLPHDRFTEIVRLVQQLGGTPLPQRLAAADGLADAARRHGIDLPSEATDWIQQTMIDALASTDEGILKRAIEAVRGAKLKAKLEPLARISGDLRWPNSIRIAALEAIANLPEARPTLVEALGEITSLPVRKRAAELLGQSGNDDAHAALVAALPLAPTELATTIAGALAMSDTGAEALLAAIESGQASPALLRSNAVAGPFSQRSAALKERVSTLTQNLPPENARLDSVIAQRAADYRKLSDGGPGVAPLNRNHGVQIFQQHCAACHKVRNTGGNIGPNLDGVGSRGVHRLVEDILDPNRNVDPAFRPSIIEMNDGRTITGAVLLRAGGLLSLSDSSGQEISIREPEIKALMQSRASLMPSTFEQTLEGQDFSDLLAFLLSLSATER